MEVTLKILKNMFKVHIVTDRRRLGEGIYVKLRSGWRFDNGKNSMVAATIIEARSSVSKAEWIGIK